MEDNKSQKNKVFFITSNYTSLDKKIQYSLSNTDGMENFNLILNKPVTYKKEDFITKVFSFDFSKEELKDKDKDINAKKYKAKILLNYIKNYDGFIFFKEDKNNFIYDFKFNELTDWTQKILPPKSINYSKSEQIKLFNEVLKVLKVKQDDKLYKDLIIDSQCYITGQPFFFDFYLEILKSCYSQKEVKTLLKMFKLSRVKLPEKMEFKEYSSILKIIEKKPNLITKHCSEKDNPEKYLASFYTILLFFRMNYEEEKKVNDFLNNKNLNKYFVEILPNNYQYFTNLEVPDEIIFEILKKENLSYKIIIDTLSYKKSIEKVLFIVIKNIEKIANIVIKEDNKIYITEIVNPKETDNLNLILSDVEVIYNYIKNNNKFFISFDEKFWKEYIKFYDENLKKLVLINKTYTLWQKIDKTFNEIKEIKMKIHKIGLSLIEKGELKNEELIEFIENEDIYFKDKKFESKGFRPLSVLKGIDIEKADDKFFKKWNESSFFKIFSFIDDEFKKALIDLVNDMKDFGKLLKLFKLYDYTKKKSIDNIDNITIGLLLEKFKNLIKTYKMEKCPN